jgi:hypothetical protein
MKRSTERGRGDSKPVIIYCSFGIDFAIYTIWSIRSLQKFDYAPIEVVVGSEEEQLFIQKRLPGIKCNVAKVQLGSFRGFSFKAFALSEYTPFHGGRDIVVCDADVLFMSDPTTLFKRYAGCFWFHKVYPLNPADYDLEIKDVSKERLSMLTLLHYREKIGFDKRPPWILNSGLFLLRQEWYKDLMHGWATGIRRLGPELMLNDQAILTIAAAEIGLEPVWEHDFIRHRGLFLLSEEWFKDLIEHRQYAYQIAIHYLSSSKGKFVEQATEHGFDYDDLRLLLNPEKPKPRWSGSPNAIFKRALDKLYHLIYRKKKR